MKQIYLTNSSQFTLVDDDIYEKYSHLKWYLSNGYACYGAKDSNFKSYERLHRIVLGCKKGEIVDHIDRNKLNNQRSNLRLVTTKENAHNQSKRKNTKNKYKGVTFVKKLNLYQSRCRINGCDYFLGYFKTEISAAYAYNKKSLELSNTILINDLSNYSIESLEEMYISDRKIIKKHIGSKYKYIGFKKKAGRMKCDKFFILFTIDKKRTYHGYFDAEEDALSVLRVKYGSVLNDIGSLK
jgi:hypothetical protein